MNKNWIVASSWRDWAELRWDLVCLLRRKARGLPAGKNSTQSQSRILRQQRKRPWSLATLIEGNSVSDSPVGIEIQPGFEGVLVRKNEFMRVKLETRS